MGDPKATEMPEAAAADRTSLLRAIEPGQLRGDTLEGEWKSNDRRTFVVINVREELGEKIRTATCNMNQRSFLSQPHARCHG